MEIPIVSLNDPSMTLVQWADAISNLRREYPDTSVLTLHSEEGTEAILTLDKSLGNDVSIPGDVTLSVSDVVIRTDSDLR